MIRVGIGYDIHPLKEGCPLILGGTVVDAPFGAVGHSDADALIHAVIDALLGAASLGDIGEHFPPSDPQYRGISSMKLLARACATVKDNGWQVVNIDAVVILEKPRLAPYRSEMIKNIAEVLQVDHTAVNVKAKTREGMGPAGTGTAVEAHAVALIQTHTTESDEIWV